MKEQKDLDFKFIKAPDDAGTFLGYASVFGVVDSYNDIVQPGAFKKALKERAYFPLLWSHSINEPIGIVTGREDDRGLAVTGKLNLDVQKAVEIRSLMKQGAVNGLSIGYEPGKHSYDDDHHRILEEIRLWEISPVVFPAQIGATVQVVKRASPELSEEQGMKLLEAFYQQAQILNLLLRSAKIRLELEELIQSKNQGERS